MAAKAGAGAGQAPEGAQAPGATGGGGPGAGPDWAGLPEHVLMKVAEKHIAQTEAGHAAQLKERGEPEQYIQQQMARRRRRGDWIRCPIDSPGEPSSSVNFRPAAMSLNCRALG